ncbi:tripartite tricarboxylate transporter TctB family protein [Elioraea sp.]|uniref:tripartite tricarboxylate transporter TctB family protein n=1 Tax=Elioraea sp. TaxID=2185103 RepID=UPI0025C658A0|nr:tripartite tricarboxylate transporter TctB family protein [Elioraea sp.]
MELRVRETMIGVAGASLGTAVLLLVPAQVPGATIAAIGDMRSPAFFPVLAAIIVLAGATGIVLAQRRAEPPAAEAMPTRPWAAMAAVIAGGTAVPFLGIYAGLLVAMLGIGVVLRTRPLAFAITTAVSLSAVHLLFARTLRVVFPDPTLPLPSWWPH